MPRKHLPLGLSVSGLYASKVFQIGVLMDQLDRVSFLFLQFSFPIMMLHNYNCRKHTDYDKEKYMHSGVLSITYVFLIFLISSSETLFPFIHHSPYPSKPTTAGLSSRCLGGLFGAAHNVLFGDPFPI